MLLEFCSIEINQNWEAEILSYVVMFRSEATLIVNFHDVIKLRMEM